MASSSEIRMRFTASTKRMETLAQADERRRAKARALLAALRGGK